MDAELLSAFADHRGPWVLTWLDVSAGRQPQARFAVRDEQQLTARVVEDDEVAHQVHRGNVRLVHPVERGSAGDPLRGGLQVGALQAVPGFDGANQLQKAGTRLIVMVGERGGPVEAIRASCQEALSFFEMATDRVATCEPQRARPPGC
ncbi:hypothetical protein [Streptomyces adustus]|uniref:hypothetical protein n=1 Tax=Streptomyces adustus TaxID=1609272 RepID=UPI0037135AA6